MDGHYLISLIGFPVSILTICFLFCACDDVGPDSKRPVQTLFATPSRLDYPSLYGAAFLLHYQLRPLVGKPPLLIEILDNTLPN